MSLEERRSFDNLILLCKFHHTAVDNKLNEKKFPADVLRQWKERRERALASRIKGLSHLTEEQLLSHLQKAASEQRDEVLTAIGDLRGVADEVVATLKEIVDEPFRRQTVDPDGLASLERSAGMLSFLHDHTPVLARSAEAIGHLVDYSGPLQSFARAVENMPDLSALGNAEYVSATLEMGASRVDQAVTRVDASVERLAEVAGSLNTLTVRPEAAECSESGAPPSRPKENSDRDAQSEGAATDRAVENNGWISRIPVQFRWGLGVGMGSILLIQLIGILFFT
ncbi:hypothetical protein [Symbioplanes lichenis]|uniref:hypothetical protein n=1 Tax=Symbioplanes lichenis TaxID=1629072 RepID=UPI002738C0FA|nr:hypothetical protein [Actinoplanes lichenis]